jgi:hydrogenase expression/formation protein HypC
MCLGIPGEVIALMADVPDLAVVRVEGVERPINVGLLREESDGVLDLVPGEWILIHLGFALSKIDEQEAKQSLAWVTGADDAFESR